MSGWQQMGAIIKQLADSDISRILQIQLRCYTEAFLEETASFRSKLRFFSQGCVGIVQKDAPDTLMGYLISFPWFADRPVLLNSATVTTDEIPEYTCYYIHDLALPPEVRGLGYGQQLVNHAKKLAIMYGHEQIYLISVQNSSPYWKKHGFDIVKEVIYGKDQSKQESRQSYLMVNNLSRLK